MVKKKPLESNPSHSEPDPRWRQLTWDDLDAWAGGRAVERGRSYQRQGHVKHLAIFKDHRLLATVMGGQRYIVSVWLNNDEKEEDDAAPLESNCTCPVGDDGCKHAVAVVAEYLDRLKQKADVTTANVDDPRWATLESGAADDEKSFDSEGDDDDDEPVRRPTTATRREWDEKIKQHIHAKSREELADLVCSLVERFPELRDEFRERIALGEGDADRLIAQARKEIHRVTAEEAWRSGWTGQGHLPDYGKIKHRLERLAEMGNADAVVRLGRELIERGIEQVGRSNDEGETAGELSACLPVIFRALVRSSLPPVKKLLFAIDACLKDDYDIIGDSANSVMNAEYPQTVWSAVADELSSRLSSKLSTRCASDGDGDEEEEKEDNNSSDHFSRDYHRDQITNWLGMALEKAGRAEELLTIYESEARRTNSYERLVRVLIEQKKEADALRWAAEGIVKTVDKWPGIASSLAKELCELARRKQQWEIVAAHAAHLFFETPSPQSFHELTTAADQARCGDAVHTFAMRFLETDVSPIRLKELKKDKANVAVDPNWPLPVPHYLEALLLRQRRRDPSKNEPHFDVLIDLAIADKRPADVLRWYNQWKAQPKPSPYSYGWSGSGGYADRVAAAVASSHPQRTAEIYRAQIDQLLPQASTSAYESVAAYLRKLKPVLKSIDREPEWSQLMQQIRERYRNRPRFMETLDRLESTPILSNRGSSR